MSLPSHVHESVSSCDMLTVTSTVVQYGCAVRLCRRPSCLGFVCVEVVAATSVDGLPVH